MSSQVNIRIPSAFAKKKKKSKEDNNNKKKNNKKWANKRSNLMVFIGTTALYIKLLNVEVCYQQLVIVQIMLLVLNCR